MVVTLFGAVDAPAVGRGALAAGARTNLISNPPFPVVGGAGRTSAGASVGFAPAAFSVAAPPTGVTLAAAPV
jgi:hypothetical protein